VENVDVICLFPLGVVLYLLQRCIHRHVPRFTQLTLNVVPPGSEKQKIRCLPLVSEVLRGRSSRKADASQEPCAALHHELLQTASGLGLHSALL